MLFEEISPFVRYASHIKCSVPDLEVCACDTHFYYFLCESKLWINGETHTMKRGSVAIIPPATPYKFICEGALEVLSINFDYTISNSNIESAITPVSAESFDKNSVIERIFFDDAELLNKTLCISHFTHEALILRIVKEFSSRLIYYRQICSALLNEVILQIAREGLLGSTGNKKIESAIEFIKQNYSKNLSNEDIARVVGYHPYHLSRLFKKYTGKTLRQYLIDVRLSSAKALLTETDLSVSEIALLCGYNALCNFSLDFKRKFGLNPSDLKKHKQLII